MSKTLITALLFLCLAFPILLSGTSLGTSSTLARAQTSQARKADALRLLQEGKRLLDKSQFQAALEKVQQALAIYRELCDRTGEAAALNSLGEVYIGWSQDAKALESLQQALAISKEVKDRSGEGKNLDNLGKVYNGLSLYSKALDVLQQALLIHREVGDRAGVGKTYNNLGEVYSNLGQYSMAMELFEQALAIHREIGNKVDVGTTLDNIGLVYVDLGQYAKALEFHQQALSIFRELTNRAEEAKVLNNIGLAYYYLGQYSQGLSQYLKSLQFFKQALAIHRETGVRAEEGVTLNNIGLVYDGLSQTTKALEFYQQALPIFRETRLRAEEGTTLNNIGLAYYNIGQYPKALEFYQQALAINRELKVRAREGITLTNIGALLEKQKQPELAIIFYKRFVNLAEAIRQDIRVLPREQQESYTKTVGYTYRSLATLLLSQGRILEAQQVLELLKIQEIRNFTKDTRAGVQTAGIALNPTEKQIVKEYGTLIGFGQQLETCQQTQCEALSRLLDQRDALTQQYNQTVRQLEQEIRTRRAQDDAFFDPKKLSKTREVVEAQPNTVLIYPLVLEDKIWLLWASKGGIVKSLKVSNVGERQMAETVLKFRQLLQDPNSDLAAVKATGKQLYDWLILPLEVELKANKIQNLVFSLDRATRYIPMSALFDGKNYLIENYAISTVLSADLTDMRDRLSNQNTSVLALGLSNGVAGFNPLPNVPAELDAIVRKKPNDTQGIYPGLEFLNSAFDFRALRDHLVGHQLLHIATHGKFVPGNPDASYLLLGTGQELAIPTIATLQDLRQVHLVVLSACETALGGPGQDGTEISGISYYFLNAGAKAVMASLWQVNDESTSRLMQNFYGNLAKGSSTAPITKTSALRQAQLFLLRGDVPRAENADSRASLEIRPRQASQTASTNSSAPSFAHPYYWAPFILIGNWM
jgi:CHAT domain-containing protein/Flp pilus assembly protein TadD